MVEYEQWEQSVPAQPRGDPLWSFRLYRAALYAAVVGDEDASRLSLQRRSVHRVEQLSRAVDSISANIAEGYSRGFAKERARFYEYALGSAREARDWYYKLRNDLPNEVVATRVALLARIIRTLLILIPRHRGKPLRTV
jgi:four helix bundle protein